MASIASACRFAGNTSIDLAQLRTARRKAVLEMCAGEKTILVINDMSVLNYNRHESKSDRRAIGDGRSKGYEYICNLAVGLESERYLGVLHDSLISASGPDDTDQIDYHANPTFAALSKNDPARLERNHAHMLACHFKHISQSAPGIKMISVADREFDDHYVFENAIRCGQDAVIGSNGVRNVQVTRSLEWVHEDMYTTRQNGLPGAPGHACCSMKTLVANVPTTPFKQLALDGKGRLVEESAARSHAHVSTGSFRVKLYRPPKRNGTYFRPTDYIDLNVVVVKEDNPPKDRPPIEWVLYTTLPVDTPEQVAQVVRIYELRWLIESFFKYLKSGFQIEDLRYDNARKTAVHLVAVTIAAAFICKLKAQVGLPRPGLLPPGDYARVKHAANHPDDTAIDADLRLFALLATHCGWRGRKNDPISPLTLMKGFARLTTALHMLNNAAGLLQEIDDRNGGVKNACNR
ncbi:MAG TPA: transposase [Kiritimatiellia bacterium]|nr:transposase [Kiritimatiellia bacterium]HMP00488.1 transposase [Kiritimatiellia bacterium]